MILLRTADGELFDHFRDWATGSFEARTWATADHARGALLLIATPEPWRFLVAFCEQNGSELTPLLLLKNAVPLYEGKDAFVPGQVAPEQWEQMRRMVMFHNPGLNGCLELFETRFLEGRESARGIA